MSNLLHHHRLKLTALFLAANLGLLLHLAAGDLKAVAEWVWLDIVGEGGSTLLSLVWLGLILKSRPAGRVTNLLAIGLSCVFFSWWIDLLDEFIRLPDSITWDHWLESAPMPVGLLFLTYGMYHWHHEQLAISQQMEKRERLFREHRLFDKLTPLGGADYLRKQLQLSLQQSARDQQPLSLVVVDINHFDGINQRYGHDYCRPLPNCCCSTCASKTCSAAWPATGLWCCWPIPAKPSPASWPASCARPCKVWRTSRASRANVFS